MTAAGESPRGRRHRDRARTESDLLQAAFDLLQRDGIFAGLNLNEVAERAGVNRGQIYQYFGDRRSLLRAAVSDRARAWARDAAQHWEAPFAERRRAKLRSELSAPVATHVEALLAIDADPDLSILPEIARTRDALRRDQYLGDLPATIDAEALHVITISAAKGYVIFRESFARDLGISVDELDERVVVAFDDVLAGLAGGDPRPS